MHKVFMGFCVLFGLATQAAALSCLRPDPIDTFHRVAAAEESYYVLYGQLDFDAGALPGLVDQRRVLEPEPIPARFTGKGLTRSGFDADYSAAVDLQIRCAGPWCGSANAGVDAVIFARVDDGAVTVEVGACGGTIFENPGQPVLDMLASCMRGERCLSQPLQ